MLLLSSPICNDCSCERSCSMSLSLLSRVICSSIRIWLSSAICCKDKLKDFLSSPFSSQLLALCSDFAANLSIYAADFFCLGKFRKRDCISCLKGSINSMRITENAISAYICKRILLPAFHWFPSDTWSSFGLTFLAQTSVPYAVSYSPSPSAVHPCQLHVWLDLYDSWSQPIYSQPSHGKEKKKITKTTPINTDSYVMKSLLSIIRLF